MNRPIDAEGIAAPPLLALVARFGLVGLLATAVHAAVYMLTVSRNMLTPLEANGAGFCVAFAISFIGHRHWTFAHQQAELTSSLPRFLATALLGLASNSAITWLFVEQLRWPPASALWGILLFTPTLVFVCSRYWAFADARKKGEPADKPGSV